MSTHETWSDIRDRKHQEELAALDALIGKTKETIIQRRAWEARQVLEDAEEKSGMAALRHHYSFTQKDPWPDELIAQLHEAGDDQLGPDDTWDPFGTRTGFHSAPPKFNPW